MTVPTALAFTVAGPDDTPATVTAGDQLVQIRVVHGGLLAETGPRVRLLSGHALIAGDSFDPDGAAPFTSASSMLTGLDAAVSVAGARVAQTTAIWQGRQRRGGVTLQRWRLRSLLWRTLRGTVTVEFAGGRLADFARAMTAAIGVPVVGLAGRTDQVGAMRWRGSPIEMLDALAAWAGVVLVETADSSTLEVVDLTESLPTERIAVDPLDGASVDRALGWIATVAAPRAGEWQPDGTRTVFGPEIALGSRASTQVTIGADLGPRLRVAEWGTTLSVVRRSGSSGTATVAGRQVNTDGTVTVTVTAGTYAGSRIWQPAITAETEALRPVDVDPLDADADLVTAWGRIRAPLPDWAPPIGVPPSVARGVAIRSGAAIARTAWPLRTPSDARAVIESTEPGSRFDAAVGGAVAVIERSLAYDHPANPTLAVAGIPPVVVAAGKATLAFGSATTNSVTLIWSDPAPAASKRLHGRYIRTGQSGTWTPGGGTPDAETADTAITFRGLRTGTSYDFEVSTSSTFAAAATLTITASTLATVAGVSLALGSLTIGATSWPVTSATRYDYPNATAYAAIARNATLRVTATAKDSRAEVVGLPQTVAAPSTWNTRVVRTVRFNIRPKTGQGTGSQGYRLDVRLQTGADPSPPPSAATAFTDLDVSSMRLTVTYDGRQRTHSQTPQIYSSAPNNPNLEEIVVQTHFEVPGQISGVSGASFRITRPSVSDGFTLAWTNRNMAIVFEVSSGAYDFTVRGTVTRDRDGARRPLVLTARIAWPIP